MTDNDQCVTGSDDTPSPSDAETSDTASPTMESVSADLKSMRDFSVVFAVILLVIY